MTNQLEQDKKVQKWRDGLMILCTICLFIGGPVFALQYDEYRLIRKYQEEAFQTTARITDLRAEYYRRRTDYTIDITYGTATEFLVFDQIDKVLHSNTFNQLSIGDEVKVLVLPSDGEFVEGNVLLEQATTMEYWGQYFWRMVIAGTALVIGIALFIYIFITRKQAVARVQRIKNATSK